LSDIGCTSFFPSKPLGCYGDGGAVFTDDDRLAAKLRALSVHGQTARYRHEYIGLNSRLDTIQAAILNVKLKYFDAEVKARHAIGARYTELLASADCITPLVLADRTHMYAQYSVRVKDRDGVVARLKEAGVPTAIHYPMPIHAQPCFKSLGYVDADFPVSAKICQEIMSLPMGPFLTEQDQNRIVKVLRGI
jgi:UDP-2-acetamido-2-deoxy-ribo-hexuluronate aminotransferase